MQGARFSRSIGLAVAASAMATQRVIVLVSILMVGSVSDDDVDEYMRDCELSVRE